MLFRTGSSEFGHLQETDRFEAEWAEKIGTKYSLLMCGGGTAAIASGLAGMGIGFGNEVIVPSYTWLATASAALMVGAIPVLADIDETLGLDSEDFERKISPHTKAVIPVHMMGRPVNMEAVLSIAKKHNIKVVEDCCQMVGESYKGKRVGTCVGAYSFNYYKIISVFCPVTIMNLRTNKRYFDDFNAYVEN